MLIAEVGQNFMGDMNLARELICLAKNNGADLVKFQLYDHNILYGDNPDIPDVALSKEQAFGLFIYGKNIGIEVFFSVFDVERVKWCEEMGVKRYKIAYSHNTNLDVVSPILETSKPIYVSVAHINKLRDWYDWLSRQPSQVKPLYCVSEYPASPDRLQLFDVSLEAPDPLKSTFKVFDGFSDHTIGLDACKIAISRGAKIIEKHFCDVRRLGVDARWSMTPSELRELRRFYDIVQLML